MPGISLPIDPIEDISFSKSLKMCFSTKFYSISNFRIKFSFSKTTRTFKILRENSKFYSCFLSKNFRNFKYTTKVFILILFRYCDRSVSSSMSVFERLWLIENQLKRSWTCTDGGKRWSNVDRLGITMLKIINGI